jgi:uncharacterized protein (DUF1697 family)
MQTWIALLRGINVGGKNILPMASLVADLHSLKLQNIRTYIQSGNVVFETRAKNRGPLAEKIAARIEQQHGFRPHVLLLSEAELQHAISANPFSDSDPKSVHFFFLDSTPTAPDIKSLDDAKAPREEYRIADQVLYLHAPDGIGRSKLAKNAERYLGVVATARNLRTVHKLSTL